MSVKPAHFCTLFFFWRKFWISLKKELRAGEVSVHEGSRAGALCRNSVTVQLAELLRKIIRRRSRLEPVRIFFPAVFGRL